MSVQEEVTKALAAHSMWKARLKGAIQTGKSDKTPEQLGVDNGCDFGKWFYSLPVGERNSELTKKIQALHASFHKEAAVILRQALSGHKSEAEKHLGDGSEFDKVSTDLTLALSTWKKEHKPH
jgi:hypothetical protein